MARPEKVEAVAEIKERFAGAEAVFVAEYAGLSVGEQQKLRRGLRAAEGEFKVVKMTLARRAVSELGHDDLLEMLVGPTGLAFASGDAAAAAKALRDFSRDHQRLVIKGGLLGSEVLPPERVTELADIEPREVLLAKIAGAFQAPMATMAGLLAAMPRALATMVQQLIDRAPEAPEEQPTADEPAAEEAPAAEAETEVAPVAEAAAESAADADGSASSDDSSDDSDDSDESSDDDAAEKAEEE
ncbi:MAG TPA: 50S ribosomal protein L10 [Acidimicrobiia bacterium]|nr:50S ribosomal protein L10 [Acidimicrobiia bacterium]